VILLLGVISSLAIAALAEVLPLEAEPRPLAWLVLGLGLPAASAVFATSLVRLAPPLRSDPWRGRWVRRCIDLSLFLATYAVILFPLGWGRWVLLELGWRGTPFLAAAWMLLPAALASLWLSPWSYRREARFFAAGAAAAPGFGGWLRRAARLAAVPAGVFLALSGTLDVARRLPFVAERLDLYPSLSLLILFAVMFLLLAAAPYLILLAWPSTPFPGGSLRESLEDIAVRMSVALRAIRIWGENTASSVNACVAGFVPGTRHVIFTRGICHLLEPRELAAVFSHEAAHVARGHLGCYLLLVFAYLFSLGPLEKVIGHLPELSAVVLFGLYSLLWWRFLFGALSRRLELEADLTGAEAVGIGAYGSALGKVGQLLGSAAARDSWRHYGLEERLRRLSHAVAVPGSREALLATCRRWKRGAVVLALLAVAAFAASTIPEMRRPAGELALEGGSAALERAENLDELLAERARVAAPATGPGAWLRRSSPSIAAEQHAHLERALISLEEADHLLPPDSADRARCRELLDRAGRLRQSTKSL
jgi:Zn-dependent protease with chaperone function